MKLSLVAPVVLAGAALPVLAAAADLAGCSARSARTVTPLVELYTSEGCNSCPPADRWLSAMRARPEVVALAFHVDYWDRLGWKDRFASPAFTERQARQQAVNGARFSYTPQVVVDGVDRKDWPAVEVAGGRAASPASRVDVGLTRDAAQVVARVTPNAGAPARLAAYWTLTEDGHSSAVKAGENEGTTLRHDFVVREWQAVPAWDAVPGRAAELRFAPKASADAAHARAVNLVVIDEANGRPVQALRLGC